MKRFLFILLLLPLFACSQQVGFVNIGTVVPPTPPDTNRILIEDNFDGSSLSANWTVQGSPTITVTGGWATIEGTDGYDKDYSQRMRYTGYLTNGQSTIRNYIIEIGLMFNEISDSTRGVYVGADSPISSDFRFSSWGQFDHSTLQPDALAIEASNLSARFVTPDSTRTSIPTINTTDYYTLRIQVWEDGETVTLTNNTTTATRSVTHIYDITAATWPLRPNIFYYSMGVMASANIKADYFRVTTSEVLNPWGVWVGNSITTGYTSGSVQNSFAYLLRSNTDSTMQVMAGAGMNMLHTIDNLDEIIEVSPTYVFLNIGTNAGGNFTNYQTIVSTLEAAGIDVIPTMNVNGGNPATGGTFNNSIATTYSDEIDTWTTGWNTMTIGNGQMHDALHPTLTGMQKLADVIKAARPDLFPLFILLMTIRRRKKAKVISMNNKKSKAA